MENYKFPHWTSADDAIIHMASDLGAHVYVSPIDNDCPFIPDDNTPIVLLIPYQWFYRVPSDCKDLFQVLYNEFADAVFYDIKAQERIFDKFIAEAMSEELRCHMREELLKALCDYDKELLEKWDGDINKPRSIRDKFLQIMGCDEKPLCFTKAMISDFVKEGDKQWVV